MSTSSYIPSLDGLRAISIALVFASHVGFGHMIPGGFGVTIFFFLSGYLITTLLTREWDRYGAIAQRAFYMRRLVRLGPPILLALLVSYALLAAGLVEGGFDVRVLLSQILFFYNYYVILVPTGETVKGLGVLWSLAVEEHFYLLWPTLFILICRHGIRVWTVVVLLGLILGWRAIRYYFMGTAPDVTYIATDTRFDSLLYGCLLALMAWRGTAQALFAPDIRAMTGWLAGAIIVLLFCLVYRDDGFRAVLRYSLQGLALMPIFFYAVTQPRFVLFQPLNWRWVRRIGQWSFSIYLVHFVIINALIHNGFGQLGDPPLVALSLALSIGFAAGSYALVEKPFQPIRRRLVGHTA